MVLFFNYFFLHDSKFPYPSDLIPFHEDDYSKFHRKRRMVSEVFQKKERELKGNNFDYSHEYSTRQIKPLNLNPEYYAWGESMLWCLSSEPKAERIECFLYNVAKRAFPDSFGVFSSMERTLPWNKAENLGVNCKVFKEYLENLAATYTDTVETPIEAFIITELKE